MDQEAKKKQMARKEKRRKEVNKKINDLVISEFDAGIWKLFEWNIINFLIIIKRWV